MPQIDFITALARLLRDADLRASFGVNPVAAVGRLGVTDAARETLLQLKPLELESQAQVLLRKRFEAVRLLIPFTCASLNENAWPAFEAYGWTCWPSMPLPELRDANEFCRHLERTFPGAVCASERNRLQFALGKTCLAFYLVRDLPIGHRRRYGLQLFIRQKRFSWREHQIYIAL